MCAREGERENTIIMHYSVAIFYSLTETDLNIHFFTESGVNWNGFLSLAVARCRTNLIDLTETNKEEEKRE